MLRGAWRQTLARSNPWASPQAFAIAMRASSEWVSIALLATIFPEAFAQKAGLMPSAIWVMAALTDDEDIHMTLDELIDNFAFLDDWNERYRYIIELGRDLPAFDDALKNDINRVQGCVSQVWLVARQEGERIHFLADSDAHIVRGLVAIVRLIFSGKTRQEIQGIDVQPLFAKLGLDQHLSPSRSNGLHAMVRRIHSLALEPSPHG